MIPKKKTHNFLQNFTGPNLRESEIVNTDTWASLLKHLCILELQMCFQKLFYHKKKSTGNRKGLSVDIGSECNTDFSVKSA